MDKVKTKDYWLAVIKSAQQEVRELEKVKEYFLEKSMGGIFKTETETKAWDYAYDLAVFKIKFIEKRINKIITKHLLKK